MEENNLLKDPLLTTQRSSDLSSPKVLVIFISIFWFFPLIISLILFTGSLGDNEYWGLWLILHSGPFTDSLMNKDGPTVMKDFLPAVISTMIFGICAFLAFQKQLTWLALSLSVFVIIWYLMSAYGFINNFHPG